MERKPKHLKFEEECTLNDYGQVFGVKLESKLENVIRESFATKSCTAVDQILSAFKKALGPSELHALAYDGHESSAQVV
jgi:hypothetical protein